MIQLAATSGKLPQSIYIRGVTLDYGIDPVAHGGFADIFLGSYDGKKVALKTARATEQAKSEYFCVRRFRVLCGNIIRLCLFAF